MLGDGEVQRELCVCGGDTSGRGLMLIAHQQNCPGWAPLRGLWVLWGTLLPTDQHDVVWHTSDANPPRRLREWGPRKGELWGMEEGWLKWMGGSLVAVWSWREGWQEAVFGIPRSCRLEVDERAWCRGSRKLTRAPSQQVSS